MKTLDLFITEIINAVRTLSPGMPRERWPKEIRDVPLPYQPQRDAYNPGPGISLTIPPDSIRGLMTRDITTSGYTVASPRSSIIGKAKDTIIFDSLIGIGIETVPRLEGQFGYPTESTTVDATVNAEGSGPSEAGATIGLQTRGGHQLMATVYVSRHTLQQVPNLVPSFSAIGTQAILAKAAQQLLAGSGSGELLGLLSDTSLTAVSLATLNADKLADLIEAVGFGDERDLRCIIAPGAANVLRQRDLSTATSGLYALRNGMLDGCVPTVTSGHMSSGTLLLGDFRNACTLIMYGGIDVWLDPFSLSSAGSVKIVFYALVDSVVLQAARIVRGTSIS